jgi:hypothetical protein
VSVLFDLCAEAVGTADVETAVYVQGRADVVGEQIACVLYRFRSWLSMVDRQKRDGLKAIKGKAMCAAEESNHGRLV